MRLNTVPVFNTDCTNALAKSPNVTSPVGLPIASISAWPSMMRVAFCMSTVERLDGHEIQSVIACTKIDFAPARRLPFILPVPLALVTAHV